MSIPKNEIGLDEYDHGVDSSENLIAIVFPEEEVYALFSDGIFDKINDLLFENEKASYLGIDDYESEWIPQELLNDCIEMVHKNKYPVFYKALQLASEYKMPLWIDL